MQALSEDEVEDIKFSLIIDTTFANPLFFICILYFIFYFMLFYYNDCFEILQDFDV